MCVKEDSKLNLRCPVIMDYTHTRGLQAAELEPASAAGGRGEGKPVSRVARPRVAGMRV